MRRMYEWACEKQENCDTDQYSFKAYLARWLAKSSIVAPFMSNAVTTLLQQSAQAAAQSCSGGAAGTSCGTKWYVGGYDGVTGVGQQLSALETIQSLMLLSGDMDAARRYPAKQGNVQISQATSTSTLSVATATATGINGQGTASSGAVANVRGRVCVSGSVLVVVPVVIGMVVGGGLLV